MKKFILSIFSVTAILLTQCTTQKNDSTPHNTRGHETQTFQKDSIGRWKLTHIHYSSAN
ncbi:MAG: hypothetical protein ACI4SO_01380 [Muribaculaceae bacterium]